ncbi:Sugar transporter [Pleurostoma richardsiae]|uniref:Sugar transporter n=1 Tax=Pleurostoma richardsiae TaxID=41990 RepID=A0AA38RIG3_9PEZI|nr:Sugar transporter [Pleurostoma richardsiae]
MAILETLKKHKAAIGVSATVNIGACLFGFDTGVAGGVIALGSFKKEFHLATSKSKYADASSNVVTLLNAGAFFGALAPPLASRYVGRKVLLAIAGAFFLVGGVLQTAAQGPTLGMIYAGRVIAGLGVGMISNVAPVFVAECAPKELRGVMMSLFEMFLVSGGMLAYWTTYGCSLHLPVESKQWRVPLSLQIILASLVIASSFLVPESPRWLAKQDRYEEATATLSYLRSAPADSAEITDEMAEIRAQIQEELAATQGRTVREIFEAHNFIRVLWALGVGLCAMWCGHNAILYYGPTVFAQIGYTAQNAALMASGIFTCIKFASTVIFIVGGVQFFSRKTLMAGGSFFMGAFLFALGAVLSTHPPSAPGNGEGSPSARGMMALIYLFVVAYSLSWGPLQWVYIGEIFPTRIRDYGMAIGAANIWLWNFVVSKITPTSVLNIGWKTWMIFGTLNICGCIFALLLPETKDLSLEQMDVLFGVVDENTRQHDIEMNLQAKGATSTSEREG